MITTAIVIMSSIGLAAFVQQQLKARRRREFIRRLRSQFD
jgi:hypothetical protein